MKYEIEKVSIHIDQLYSRKYPDFEVFRSYPQNDIRRAGRLINFNQYATEFLKKVSNYGFREKVNYQGSVDRDAQKTFEDDYELFC